MPGDPRGHVHVVRGRLGPHGVGVPSGRVALDARLALGQAAVVVEPQHPLIERAEARPAVAADRHAAVPDPRAAAHAARAVGVVTGLPGPLAVPGRPLILGRAHLLKTGAGVDTHVCLLSVCLAWSFAGSNRGPPACEAGALPPELKPLDQWISEGPGRAYCRLPSPAQRALTGSSRLSCARSSVSLTIACLRAPQAFVQGSSTILRWLVIVNRQGRFTAVL